MKSFSQRELFTPFESFLYRQATKFRQKTLFYTLFRRIKRPIKDIISFRSRHRGQRCFILGGGPSLNRIDPAFLKTEITFGVNGIFLIYDWLGFEPTYYVVEDRLVYEDRFNEILTYVNKSICFFPIQFSSKEFDRINHNYFRALYEFDQHPNWPYFSIDPSKIIWIGGTVIYVCLQLAFFMGFKSVYLLGMDHYYKKPVGVIERGNDWTSVADDPNHFHPNYFGKGYRWHNPRIDRMEKAYIKAREVFKDDNRKVMNASVGGHLEVFERISYETLF